MDAVFSVEAEKSMVIVIAAHTVVVIITLL